MRPELQVDSRSTCDWRSSDSADDISRLRCVCILAGYRVRYEEFRVEFPRGYAGAGSVRKGSRRIVHRLEASLPTCIITERTQGKTSSEVSTGRLSRRDGSRWSKEHSLDRQGPIGFSGVTRTSGTSNRRLPGVREVAQGSQGPHAIEGRHRPLREDRRRARRDDPPDERDRRGHRAPRRLARRIRAGDSLK